MIEITKFPVGENLKNSGRLFGEAVVKDGTKVLARHLQLYVRSFDIENVRATSWISAKDKAHTSMAVTIECPVLKNPEDLKEVDSLKLQALKNFLSTYFQINWVPNLGWVKNGKLIASNGISFVEGLRAEEPVVFTQYTFKGSEGQEPCKRDGKPAFMNPKTLQVVDKETPGYFPYYCRQRLALNHAMAEKLVWDTKEMAFRWNNRNSDGLYVEEEPAMQEPSLASYSF